jgi:single-strand DNA-binding protein
MLNLAIVIGSLAKPAQVRALPNGLCLATFDLQVRLADQSPDTVPVALFDAPDQVTEWTVGQELLAIGRVKRRFFRVGGATQSRTELVADRVLPMAPEEDVRTVLADAASKISAVIADIELRPQ